VIRAGVPQWTKRDSRKLANPNRPDSSQFPTTPFFDLAPALKQSPPIGVKAATTATTLLQMTNDAQVLSGAITFQEAGILPVKVPATEAAAELVNA
jgi:hypothetical protein